jgi:hypothetical protein
MRDFACPVGRRDRRGRSQEEERHKIATLRHMCEGPGGGNHRGVALSSATLSRRSLLLLPQA